MSRGLAIKRHHDSRIKSKTKQILERWHGWWINEEVSASEIGRCASVHCKGCSCFMCGNPRRHFNEKTIQERREFQEAIYKDNE